MKRRMRERTKRKIFAPSAMMNFYLSEGEERERERKRKRGEFFWGGEERGGIKGRVGEEKN